MDIDENDKEAKGTEPAKSAAPKSKKADKAATPSASSETSSPHPDMSLAQDIHRLTMIRAGKLTADDATAIIGCKPEELLERVMRRVGTGGKSVDDAMKENERKYKPSGGQGGEKETKAEEGMKKDEEGKTTVEEKVEGECLLNSSLYRHLRTTLSYSSPSALSDADLETLDSHHQSILQSLDDAVTAATEEAGDMEVLHAKMDIARYSARCLPKDAALDAYSAVLALPKLSVGKKLDAHLEMARVSSFWGDHRRTEKVLESASRAIADGGDWDRRNRLRAYRALSSLLVRDVEGASKLLHDGIATFSCTELCDYPEFVRYAIVTSLLYLKRPELKKSIVDGSEVLQVAKDIPVAIKLANTLYECEYKAYLHTLVDIQPHLVADRYLQPHAGYLLRELHVLAYKQFLDSYQSVTLESMASSFGVGTDFLDAQLSRFIAAGRLTAKIDKYGGVVETNRPDWKNASYQEMIQKGDLLLNRIQKLGRVVDL